MTTPSPPRTDIPPWTDAEAPVAHGTAVWLPADSPPITVSGYTITGGLIYVGSGVPGAYTATDEPSLIDPQAPVRRVRLDQETPSGEQRPSYAELTSGARAAYLEWLAAGRTGATPVAHLWLFLYGLERRVLIDLAGAPGGLSEYAAIAAELTRLTQWYAPVATGTASPFFAKAAEFIVLLDALVGLADPDLRPPDGSRDDDLPMRLRVGLGRFAARQQPIAAGWAYAWYAHSSQFQSDATASRRPEDFRHAFAAQYAQAYPGGGMIIPKPSGDLVLRYRPANPGFADRTVHINTRLPDVGDLYAPVAALAAVAAHAEQAMSDAAEPIAPARPGPHPRRASTPRAASDGASGSAPATVAAGAPVASGDLPITGTGDTRATSASGPQSDATAGADERVRTAPEQRPRLGAAEALLRLVMLSGIMDGYVRAVRRHVVDALLLTPAERHQLDDRLEAFARGRPDAALVRQRFATLAAGAQQSVADLLIVTAGATGVVEEGQTAVLGAVFDMLGVGTYRLQHRLRELEVAALVGESGMDVTVLDDDFVDRTLREAAEPTAIVDALVTSSPGYAPFP